MRCEVGVSVPILLVGSIIFSFELLLVLFVGCVAHTCFVVCLGFVLSICKARSALDVLVELRVGLS